MPLMDMNINKMVLACPWRHPQRIYLQVARPSLAFTLQFPFSTTSLCSFPFCFSFLNFLSSIVLCGFCEGLQVVYPVGRKYVSAPSDPRLKLMSTAELKALFSIDDVKLPPWLDGMYATHYLKFGYHDIIPLSLLPWLLLIKSHLLCILI